MAAVPRPGAGKRRRSEEPRGVLGACVRARRRAERERQRVARRLDRRDRARTAASRTKGDLSRPPRVAEEARATAARPALGQGELPRPRAPRLGRRDARAEVGERRVVDHAGPRQRAGRGIGNESVPIARRRGPRRSGHGERRSDVVAHGVAPLGRLRLGGQRRAGGRLLRCASGRARTRGPTTYSATPPGHRDRARRPPRRRSSSAVTRRCPGLSARTSADRSAAWECAREPALRARVRRAAESRSRGSPLDTRAPRPVCPRGDPRTPTSPGRPPRRGAKRSALRRGACQACLLERLQTRLRCASMGSDVQGALHRDGGRPGGPLRVGRGGARARPQRRRRVQAPAARGRWFGAPAPSGDHGPERLLPTAPETPPRDPRRAPPEPAPKEAAVAQGGGHPGRRRASQSRPLLRPRRRRPDPCSSGRRLTADTPAPRLPLRDPQDSPANAPIILMPGGDTSDRPRGRLVLVTAIGRSEPGHGKQPERDAHVEKRMALFVFADGSGPESWSRAGRRDRRRVAHPGLRQGRSVAQGPTIPSCLLARTGCVAPCCSDEHLLAQARPGDGLRRSWAQARSWRTSRRATRSSSWLTSGKNRALPPPHGGEPHCCSRRPTWETPGRPRRARRGRGREPHDATGRSLSLLLGGARARPGRHARGCADGRVVARGDDQASHRVPGTRRKTPGIFLAILVRVESTPPVPAPAPTARGLG